MNQPKTNQNPSHTLAICLLIALLLSLALRLLLAVLTRDGYEWATHDAAMHFNGVMLLLVMYKACGANQLTARSLVVAWLTFEIISLIESFVKIFGLEIPRYIMTWQIGLTLAFCLIHYFISPNKPDELKEGYNDSSR